MNWVWGKLYEQPNYSTKIPRTIKKKTAKQHHSKLFKTPSVNCLFFAELIELILIKGSKKKVVVNKI